MEAASAAEADREVGLAFIAIGRKRFFQKLRHPAEEAPASIGGEKVSKVATTDGCKYILADDSWLLIRPSGTEPVLRVYAEGRSPEMVKALLEYGEEVAEKAS